MTGLVNLVSYANYTDIKSSMQPAEGPLKMRNLSPIMGSPLQDKNVEDN